VEKKLILRGLIAGAIAGLLALLVARVFAEPLINQAIHYESGREAAQHALDAARGLPDTQDHGEVFTRAVQQNFGLSFGIVLFGAAMGAISALVFAVCLGRTGRLRARSVAVLVAAAGFLALYLVPFLKYPATPPSIGNPDTIKARSGLYLLMVLCSILLLTGSVLIGRRLQARYGNWNATLIAAAFFVVSVGLVMWALPSFGEIAANRQDGLRIGSETPQPLLDGHRTIVFPGFPADVLYNFRVYSVATQAVLWATLGLVFAPLAERLLAPLTARQPADDLLVG